MKKFIAITLLIVALMFGEYRYIMHNQTPYYGPDGFMHIEMFGHVDKYYVE